MKRMQWEKPYIKELITAIAPHGRVLQVGFGDGFASECLREHPLVEHVIIEKDLAHVALANGFAAKHPKTHVIDQPWQKALASCGSFDVIYFHDALLKDVSVLKHSQEQGKLVLNQGKKALAFAHEAFPDLKKKKYSTQDLEEFYHNIGRKYPEDTGRFLAELYHDHQISHEMYHDFSKKHHIPLYVAPMKAEPKEIEEGFVFLQEALKHAMKPGSRFTMFCLDPTSRYEDPEFFDAIITNPHINYKESYIDVQVPSECNYYNGHQALIMVVEKVK